MNEVEEFSSDTSDDDYVPDRLEEESDEESLANCDEDIETECRVENGKEPRRKSLKRKKTNGSEPRKRQGGIKLSEENAEKEKEEAAIRDDKEVIQEEEPSKKRADDLWSSFMKDVDMKPKPKSVDKESRNSPTNDKNEEKLVITKVYEFAGEEVRVTEEVNSSSKLCNERISQQSESSTTPSTAASKKGGIGNILSQIGGKKKLSTLEKSRLDWNQFKQAEGIAEEINTFNKGRDGYLEKQAFLERADLRQFEIERSLRMSNRSNR